MEKLLMKVTMRLPEETYADIKRYADVDHRPVLYEARHFLLRGLEQRKQEADKTESAVSLSLARHKPPHRGMEWNGQERRRA